jgi:FkbM family methyltransferase
VKATVSRLKSTLRGRVSKRTWNALSSFKGQFIPQRQTAGHQQPQGDDPRVLNCMIAYNALGAYCLPISSIERPVPQAILDGKVWEKDTIDLIVRHAGDGDVVHAGTYFGDFLPALAAGIAGGAKVWAFEPNLESFRCAQVTLLLNGIANVEIANAGLGESNTSARLLTTSWDGTSMGGLSLIPPDDLEIDHLETDKIEIRSLDTAVPPERPITVIHLDVESYEKHALIGARAMIARWKPVLILENEPDANWMADNILALGYSRRTYVDNNTVFSVKPL